MHMRFLSRGFKNLQWYGMTKSIENFGFRCFFAASAKTRSMVSFLMAQSSLSFPLSSIALVAAIKTTDLLRTLAHLPGGWYNRGRE